MAEYFKANPGFSLATWRRSFPARNPVVSEQRKRIEDALRHLGVPRSGQAHRNIDSLARVLHYSSKVIRHTARSQFQFAASGKERASKPKAAMGQNAKSHAPGARVRFCPMIGREVAGMRDE